MEFSYFLGFLFTTKQFKADDNHSSNYFLLLMEELPEISFMELLSVTADQTNQVPMVDEDNGEDEDCVNVEKPTFGNFLIIVQFV